MNCPVCNVTLLMTDKQGIEIDYCPQCRGIWLDRGELDKIIERTSSDPIQGRTAERTDFQDKDHHDGDHDRQNRHGHGYGRKRNLLGDLFDF